jgi:undecaprenyl-diphosphatase
MRGFDHSIIVFCNQFAQRWHTFDSIVVFFSNSDLMKGGVMIAGLWWAWFRPSSNSRLNRSYLLNALLGAVAALFIARILAHVLPLRTRPILDPTLQFRVPFGAPAQSNGQSGVPSRAIMRRCFSPF